MGGMRIVTWNCCMGTDRKVPAMLETLRPDIAVVPESSRQPGIALPTLLGAGVPHAWIGGHDHKGLGIFAPTARSMRVLAGPAEPTAYSLAVEVELEHRTVRVLGIWTLPAATGTWATPYMDAFASILEEHSALLDESTIVAGDLNCSAQSSPDSFPAMLAELRDRHGLRSAYHSHRGEDPGQESDSTLWWRSKEDAGFHCDLVLVPESMQITDVSVGTHAEWGVPTALARSDHAPVVVDLA